MFEVCTEMCFVYSYMSWSSRVNFLFCFISLDKLCIAILDRGENVSKLLISVSASEVKISEGR